MRRSFGPLGVAALVAALFACGDGSVHDNDNFREDVLLCEDAVSYLADCCPGFDPHAIACQYSYDYKPGGCDTGPTTDSVSPALSVGESRCITSLTCDTLRGTGVCQRAQNATAYTDHSGPADLEESPYAPSTGSSHPPVCP